MARKSQHTFSKRQREQKKAEKAAQKRARQAAKSDDESTPQPEPLDDDVSAEDDGVSPTE